MQEMIDKLHARCDFCLEKELISEWGTLRMTIIEAQSLLEKEKEQIINAYDIGYKACDLDEALEINKTMFSGERYYEQTYNK